MDDAELLTLYATSRSETAFAELVRRQVDLVYSSALRQLGGNHHLAQEVTQMVFVDLARKATSLARHPSLVAWLYRCTRYAVFNTRRREARRLALGQALASDPTALPDAQPTWDGISPVLDDAVDELPEKDRAAVLLRFFAKKPFADVGRELGISENAARMRVDRAVETLRVGLARRGITSTGVALGSLVAAHAVETAPASMAPAIATAVLSAPVASGTVISIFYTMSKIKFGITAALVAAGAISLLVEVQSRNGLRAESLRLRSVSEELAQAEAQQSHLQQELQTLGATHPDAEELTRIRRRIALLKARPDGVTETRMKPLAITGRATPEAAHATFLAAIRAGDLATATQLLSFRDGASESQRAAFMANFGDAIRRRYRTPEEVFIAAYFGLVAGAAPTPSGSAYQVFDTEVTMAGVVKVRLWIADSKGEREDREYLQQTPDGWSIGLRPLTDRTAAELRALLDPATGLPKRKQP